ncbi:hypothetical protein MJ561_29145 [Klebsiella pneumoniae]|nr:hypothetical protein MJ561_29145 [Klebsiella pneumoniae]
MQKEIFEQPKAIKNTLDRAHQPWRSGSQRAGAERHEMLAQAGTYSDFVACGTPNSGMVSRYWFEALAGVPCDVGNRSSESLSQVRSASQQPTPSQSGETADTWRRCVCRKSWAILGSLAICNASRASSLVRESDLALMTKAGTKSAWPRPKPTTQLTVLLMLVAKLARLERSGCVYRA